MKKNVFFVLFLSVILVVSVSAQTHISVPLGHPIYLVLEQAQVRGLCGILPAAKPYSRAKVISCINEILERNGSRRFGRLSEAEIEILENFIKTINPERKKFDYLRGTVSWERLSKKNYYFSAEFGFGADFIFAGGYYPVAGGFKNEKDDSYFSDANHPASGDVYGDLTFLPSISFYGDLGKRFSYGLTLSGFIGKSPRVKLGTYEILDLQNTDKDDENNQAQMRIGRITTRSGPLAYFPYTYKKRWDGFIFPTGNVSHTGLSAWPDDYSIGYSLMSELAGEFFDGAFTYRLARLDREWSGMTTNGSLILNQSAQPFLAIETVINPFEWFSISALTGFLEFHNAIGEKNDAREKESSETFQNIFSIVQLEVNYKYFSVGIGSSVVWPKRFELGYISPVTENFLYQNNIGDFDNMALFLNVQLLYPGIGNIWFAMYLDELKFGVNPFTYDRSMFSYQVGGSFHIPWIPFTSLKISYTKIDPYNYTHSRLRTPWHTHYMEQNYVNFGSSLGHYIPPNSDELLIRFETIPVPQSMFSFQYQMIRHGADYGDRAVDGSSLWSELPIGGFRDDIRKYFLRDGAYQWMHIFKLGGEYSFTSLKAPLKIIVEMGVVYSYFTDIDGKVNTEPKRYERINTPQYPNSVYLIGMIGIQIFPKF